MPPATPSRPQTKAVRLTRMKPLRLHEVTNPPASAAAARRRQAALQSAPASAHQARPRAARPPQS